MSADHYQDRAACQACRQPRRTARTGQVQRHRVRPGGAWCSGGGSLSVEAGAAARATTRPNGAC